MSAKPSVRAAKKEASQMHKQKQEATPTKAAAPTTKKDTTPTQKGSNTPTKAAPTPKKDATPAKAAPTPTPKKNAAPAQQQDNKKGGNTPKKDGSNKPAAAVVAAPVAAVVPVVTVPPKPATSLASFYPKNSLTVIATYHSVLAGIVLRGSKFKLKFSTKHHVGCVNTVAVCEKYIASAGTDERIFLFTCKDKGAHCSDLGSLTPPAEVTCLAFPGNSSSYLVCGCSDGSLLVYKTREWDCQFHLPNLHDKAIKAFAFHPMGGRVGVTVGADRTVALLNMVAGKIVSKTRLPVYTPSVMKSDESAEAIPQGALLAAAAGSSVPIAVQFSAGTGELVFITMPLVVYVFDSMTFTLVCKIELPLVNPDNQICSSCVVGERTIIVGCENGQMRSATVTEGTYKQYLASVLAVSESKSAPSLSSLAVKAEVESDEESEGSDDSEDDGADEVAEPIESTGATKQTRSAFEKPNVPADSGRMRHIPDSEGPYLQHSKNAAIKAEKKKAADEKEQARRAKQREEEEAVPRLRFSAPLTLCVPADVEESQKNVPYQHKRKHPTAHGARVRSVVCQDANYRFDVVVPETKATKAALGKKRVRMDDEAVAEVTSSSPNAAFPGIATDCIIISADTEGCLIAWRIALKAHNVGSATVTPVQALHYVASCNCSGRVTEIASMMQE